MKEKSDNFKKSRGNKEASLHLFLFFIWLIETNIFCRPKELKMHEGGLMQKCIGVGRLEESTTGFG